MDMNALIEAEIRAAHAEAMCEAMQKTQAEAQMEIGRLTALVEQGKRDKEILIACRAECDDLESQLTSSQLKLADMTARHESAVQERARTYALFDEALKRKEPAQVVETAAPEWVFQVQRDGANNMTRVIATQGDR